MPYYISDQQNDCAGWATIVADSPSDTPRIIGCHQNKQDAIDQMVAVSLSEDIEPAGDWATRQMITDDDVNEQYEGMPQEPEMNQAEESPQMVALKQAYEAVKNVLDEITEKMGELQVEPSEEVIAEVEMDSRAQRQIDLSAPQFMRDNAKRGLQYHEEGLSGDGLEPQTVEDARSMAAGDITVEKWRKIAPWIARHMVDLEAADGEITAGVVAHLLWGSGSTKEEAQRTMDYAQKIIDELDAEIESERSAPAVREHRWVIRTTDEKRKQIAYTNLELRALDDSEDGWTVRGYAAVFDSPSEPLPWTEYVRKGAFRKTIKDGADVRLLIDHTGVPLARTKSGTLTLKEDERGLFMEAQLDPANPDAVKMRSALMRGDVSQMSFAFETIKDAWNKDRTVRELREVKLHDVSIVTYPAYEETSAEIRNNQGTDTPVATVPSVSLRKAQIALAKSRAVR